MKGIFIVRFCSCFAIHYLFVLLSISILNYFSVHRALVKSMGEILFLCGNNKRAVIATLSSIGHGVEGFEDSRKDMVSGFGLT